MSLIKEAKPLETEYLVIDPVDIFKKLKGTSFEDIPDKLSDLSNELTTELQDEARFNGASPNFCIKLGLSGLQGIKITVTGSLDHKKIAESDTISEIGLEKWFDENNSLKLAYSIVVNPQDKHKEGDIISFDNKNYKIIDIKTNKDKHTKIIYFESIEEV